MSVKDVLAGKKIHIEGIIESSDVHYINLRVMRSMENTAIKLQYLRSLASLYRFFPRRAFLSRARNIFVSHEKNVCIGYRHVNKNSFSEIFVSALLYHRSFILYFASPSLSDASITRSRK